MGICGCRPDVDVTPDKIEIAGPAEQLGDPGEALAQPLEVRVLGPRTQDILGRRGDRQPAAGVPVTFSVEAALKKGVEKPPSDGDFLPEVEAGEDVPVTATPPSPYCFLTVARTGAEPTGNRGFYRVTVRTDERGTARAHLNLGALNGETRIEASIRKKGEKVRFRVVVGARSEISDSESLVDSKVQVGLRLSRLEDPSNLKSLKPVRDRRVHYQFAGGPPGGLQTAEMKEKDRQSRTDDEGLSQIEVTLGHTPGVYYVLAEIEPAEGEEPVRGILLPVAAMDWVLVGLKLAGGILIFVIGVRLLGNGFLIAMSPFLHLPTENWAQSRTRGFLGGLAGGALFESSSLVTSHLTNLANGGLLTAAGGLSLVLGANVGGTMLPQILTLELGFLAAPFLALGTALFLIPRRAGLVPWAWICLGAGLTLTGWSILQDAAEVASYSQRLRTEFFFGDADPRLPFTIYATRFFVYFALGGLIAFLLRTSNLIVVIAITLSAESILGASTGIPLILGANLGSAAMVFLLSVGKRREAKRLAFANFAVQAIGCFAAVMMSLIPVQGETLFAQLVRLLTPGDFFPGVRSSSGQHLAVAHTVYNLLAGAVFLVYPRALFIIVDRFLPVLPAREELKPFHLDRNLLTVPSLALRQVAAEVTYLTEICRKSIAESFDSFRYNDLDLSEQVVRREETISEIHRELSKYLVEVCESQLSRRDASRLEILHAAASSLVRIGELGERLRDVGARKIEEKVPPDPEVDRDMNEAYDLVMAQFTNILSLLKQRDTRTEENAVKMVERLAKFSSKIESQSRQRIEQSQGESNPVTIHLQNMVYQEAFQVLFRVAGHLAHIAQSMRILSPERI